MNIGILLLQKCACMSSCNFEHFVVSEQSYREQKARLPQR